MDEPIIDRAVLDELARNVGADFVGELVGTFIEEAPRMFTELRAARLAQATDDFRRAAHSLKTNACTFGAMSLGARARALEQGGLPADDSALDELQAAFDEAVDALQALTHG